MVDAVNRPGQARTQEVSKEALKDLLGIAEQVREDVHLTGTNALARDILELEMHSSIVPESFRTKARRFDLDNLWKGAALKAPKEVRTLLAKEGLPDELRRWAELLKSRNPEKIRRTSELRGKLGRAQDAVVEYLRSHGNDPGLRDELLPTLHAIKWEVAAKLRELNLRVG